jgi:hypothetical protein
VFGTSGLNTNRTPVKALAKDGQGAGLRMLLTKSGKSPNTNDANACRSPAIIHGPTHRPATQGLRQSAYATENGNKDEKLGKESNAELAKIYSTCATKFDLEDLVEASENQPKIELVERFVDFSSKYGLGYKLSNGSYGVHFNDSTKLITHPDLFHFDYIERSKKPSNQAESSEETKNEAQQDLVSNHNFFDYPQSINKKVVLL